MTGLGTYCQAWMMCSSATAVPERLTAARAASFASSEPSVASRTFLGRGFIYLPPLGSVMGHHDKRKGDRSGHTRICITVTRAHAVLSTPEQTCITICRTAQPG